MPSAIIPLVGTETRLAGELRQFISQLNQVRDKAANLKAIADMASSGADWPGMRASFGFSSDAAAEAAYNLIGGVNSTLSTDSNIAQMLSRLG